MKIIKPIFSSGQRCRITFKGTRTGRVGKVVSTSVHGDVTLEFKNRKQVLIHQNWLEEE